MLDYFGKLNKNVIDQIKYRGTILTGEITKDNDDGTYDVKIAQADDPYPSVETAFYDEVFSVGEIVVVTFEDGNKERPRIWGHAKKIPQEPKLEEVDYSGGARVETLNAYSITATTAYVNGEISIIGIIGNCIRRGFHYGITTDYGSDVYEDGSFGEGTYNLQITELSPEETYHYQAFVLDANGDEQVGEDKTFVTTAAYIIYEKSETSEGQTVPTFQAGEKTGQCLIAESNHQADTIALRCWRKLTDKSMKLEFYNADADGYPTGNILADCSFNSDDLPETVDWFSFTLSQTVNLTSGNRYVIVVYTAPADEGMWWRHDDTNPYANGWVVRYVGYWSKITGRDLTFRVIKTVS